MSERIEYIPMYVVRDREGLIVVHGEYVEPHNAFRCAARLTDEAPALAPYTVYCRTVTEVDATPLPPGAPETAP